MTAEVLSLLARTGRESHPVAALFPMLDGGDLAALGEDIAERGLLHPIVLDQQGRTLDGRNRLAACELMGIEPHFVTYDGDDPDGYALAVNIARRNLSKGQIAVVAAKAGRLAEQTQREVARAQNLSNGRIGQAWTVLDHAPDLADQVVAGALGLDEAYNKARSRKLEADSVESRLAEVKANAPDLAELVAAESVTVAEAHSLWLKRERDLEDQRRAATSNFDRVCQLVLPVGAHQPEEVAAHWASRIEIDDTTLPRLNGLIRQLTLVREALS